MRVGIINSSFYGMKPSDRIYNLAVHKIANYHILRGDQVIVGERWEPQLMQDIDKFYFSVIFTWDLPGMIQAVNLARSWGKEVEIGGPAATFMHKYIHTQTGIEPHIGLDQRFEHVAGDYKWTFSSRGCPRACPFCIVAAIEGRTIKEYPDFIPAPNLGDNNLLACSWEHQEKVVEALSQYSMVDINSGFDCRIFAHDPEKFYNLYSKLHLAMWRFAWDVEEEEKPLRKTLTYLASKGLDRHHVMVYILSNSPWASPEKIHYRARTVIDMGMGPYLMSYHPLDSLNHKYIASGWGVITQMILYYNSPAVWKSCTWGEFSRLRESLKNGQLGLI